MAVNLYETAMPLYKFLDSLFGSWWANLIFLWIVMIPLVIILIISVMGYRYKKGVPLRTPPDSAPCFSDHILRWGIVLIIVIGSTMGIRFVERMETDCKQSIEHAPVNAEQTPQLMSAAKKKLD